MLNAEDWIPIIEQQPRDHQHVLAWITGGSLHFGESYMDIAMYLHGLFRVCTDSVDGDEPVPVSHWMPLPSRGPIEVPEHQSCARPPA